MKMLAVPKAKVLEKAGVTYFRPMQSRGPRRNGRLASLTSVEPGSNQRSGLKSEGSEKYLGSRQTDQGQMLTSVCIHGEMTVSY